MEYFKSHIYMNYGGTFTKHGMYQDNKSGLNPRYMQTIASCDMTNRTSVKLETPPCFYPRLENRHYNAKFSCTQNFTILYQVP